MRQNTLITLGASVVCGITAVFLARGWISDAIRQQYAPPPASQTAAPIMNTVPVLVADIPLEFGDLLTPESVRVVDFPEDALPAGTFTSLNDLFVDPSVNTIALRRISTNEVILDHIISGPGARGSLSARVTEGLRAVAVRVDDVTGVAGFVMPGDHVDILYTRDPETRRNGNNLVSDILLQGVKVLGIDQNLNDNATQPDIAKTVTLEVTHDDAQKLQLAMGTGKLSLTLRSAGDLSVVKNKTVARANLLSGSSAPVRKPQYRPAKVAKKTETARPTVADVTIIRGEDRNQVSVLRENNSAQNSDALAGG